MNKPQAGIVRAAFRQSKKFGFKSITQTVLLLGRKGLIREGPLHTSDDATQKCLLTLGQLIHISTACKVPNLDAENIQLFSKRKRISSV